MAILVDHMRDVKRGNGWPYRRAAHMVSDKSFEELHDFAHRLGLQKSWFQGDHYDISTAVHREARDMGAEEVHQRDLVKKMRKSKAKDFVSKLADQIKS